MSERRPASEHQLAIAQSFIVGGFLLFLTIIALFTMDLRFAGRSVDMGSNAFILNSTSVICALTAEPGYNLISAPCITTVTPINDLLAASSVQAVYQYVPENQDLWRVYNPNLPAYVVSDLQYLSRRAGYVAIMIQSVNISINGSQPIYSNVPLAAGWNLVGYPSLTVRNITDVFSIINASYTRITTYNKSDEAFITYVNPVGGALSLIEPSRGYWVNATVATTWTVYS